MSNYDNFDTGPQDRGNSIATQGPRALTVQAPRSHAALAQGFAANPLVPRMQLAMEFRRSMPQFREEFFAEVLAAPAGMVYWKPATDASAGNLRKVLKNGRMVDQYHYIGPSARMCEIAARLVRNLHLGKPDVDEKDGRVTVTVEALDLESNVSRYGTATTSLVTREGNRMSAAVVSNNISATTTKATRNVTQAIIGKAIFDELVARVLQVENEANAAALAAEKTGGKTGSLWAKHVAGWAKVKISEAELLQACGVTSADDVTPAMMTRLSGLVLAVKEGTAPRIALGLDSVEPQATEEADTIESFLGEREDGADDDRT